MTKHGKCFKEKKKCIKCETSFHTNSPMTEHMNISENILHMIDCKPIYIPSLCYANTCILQPSMAYR